MQFDICGEAKGTTVCRRIAKWFLASSRILLTGTSLESVFVCKFFVVVWYFPLPTTAYILERRMAISVYWTLYKGYKFIS